VGLHGFFPALFERAATVGVFNTISDTDFKKDTSLWYSDVAEMKEVTII
jgi:hypothetical protein